MATYNITFNTIMLSYPKQHHIRVLTDFKCLLKLSDIVNFAKRG